MDKANDYDVSEAEVIGRGAYGTVYLCKRKSDGRQIIFKVIIALKKLQKAVKFSKNWLTKIKSLKTLLQ